MIFFRNHLCRPPRTGGFSRPPGHIFGRRHLGLNLATRISMSGGFSHIISSNQNYFFLSDFFSTKTCFFFLVNDRQTLDQSARTPPSGQFPLGSKCQRSSTTQRPRWSGSSTWEVFCFLFSRFSIIYFFSSSSSFFFVLALIQYPRPKEPGRRLATTTTNPTPTTMLSSLSSKLFNFSS